MNRDAIEKKIARILDYEDICQIMLSKLKEVKTYPRLAEIGLSH